MKKKTQIFDIEALYNLYKNYYNNFDTEKLEGKAFTILECIFTEQQQMILNNIQIETKELIKHKTELRAIEDIKKERE